VDVLSNCRAEQLHEETVPYVASMLSEIIEGLEGDFEKLADVKEMDAGPGELYLGGVGDIQRGFRGDRQRTQHQERLRAGIEVWSLRSNKAT
jgi:hypothetical protein